ncbi:hypothetical protein [Streptomyces tsukubensis]|uniref:hypothetical protein n=1 Tax=Streptomyces tsukubensis TaxID=83656 RepID=UPI00344FE7D4
MADHHEGSVARLLADAGFSPGGRETAWNPPSTAAAGNSAPGGRGYTGAQHQIRTCGPAYVRDLDLISLEELHAIRHEWVVVKHEVDDIFPAIYLEENGEPFPGPAVLDGGFGFDADAMAVLREVCDGDESQYQGVRALLGVERRFRTAGRRAGCFEALEKTVTRYMFTDEDDALRYAIAREDLRSGLYDQSGPEHLYADGDDDTSYGSKESS